MARKTYRGEDPSNREEKILAVALALFVERGVDATSMREIANDVGITKATLYHYFPGKEAICAAIFERHAFHAGAVREIAEGGEPLRDRLRPKLQGDSR